MKTKIITLFYLVIFNANTIIGQEVKTATITFKVNPVQAKISDLIEYERQNFVEIVVPDLSKKIPKTGYPQDLPLPEGAKIIPFVGTQETKTPIIPTPSVASPSPSLTFESLIMRIMG